MNKVYEVIISEYGYDEPVFTKDLKALLKDSMSDDALRQNMKRLADNGDLLKVENGIYYVPRKRSVLKNPRVNLDKVITRKYIKPKDEEIIGYTCGINFANQLGITSQTASITTIVSNATGRIRNEVSIGMKVIRLRKPKAEITSNNYKLLQVLDLLNDYERVCEVPINNAINNIYKYLDDVNITQNEFNDCLNKYSKKTVLRALDLGLNNEFTRR
ncbi:hypothetical protein [Bacillus cereus group sp. BfR-BA-01523]|uniref:hypothetical protein n=1 Tax=Bacillus cereus group sp. BfR-BA-01523 TaxID=2920371 RepID=UPI001F588ABE|nr:hypothetical protein [Bacillus cereus group sp. BfR-BA-01523]